MAEMTPYTIRFKTEKFDQELIYGTHLNREKVLEIAANQFEQNQAWTWVQVTDLRGTVIWEQAARPDGLPVGEADQTYLEDAWDERIVNEVVALIDEAKKAGVGSLALRRAVERAMLYAELV